MLQEQSKKWQKDKKTKKKKKKKKTFTDMWNLKKGQNELLCRTDTDSQTEKLMVSKGDGSGGGEIRWGCGMEIL